MKSTGPLSNWRCFDDAAKLVPLSPHQMEMLVRFSMANEETLERSYDDAIGQFLPLQILHSRLQQAGWDIEKRLVFFLASICETPGQAVMWAYTIAVLADEQPDNSYDLKRWCEGPFAMGIPSKEAIDEAWDYQKGHVHGIKRDNLLDQIENWPTRELQPA